MRVRIQTPETEFTGDLADVVRLFYGDAAVAGEEETDAPLLIHTRDTLDDGWLDRWVWGADVQVLRTQYAGTHPLELKRERKRAIKGCLYRLLKRRTGMRLPWGSLTGIRPTRLVYEGMEHGLTLPQAMERMVTEFDVSEERAALLGDIVRMQEGRLKPAEDEFDLYIGIPFCRTRCSYCSFASGELGDGKLVEPYVEALLREIRLCGDMLSERGLHVRAAYIGGGTPTAIPCEALDRILTAAQLAFPGAVEWTVEAGRPDTIDRDKLLMLRRHGVGRISINPQSFSDETLKRIGRGHTGEDILRAYAMARELGFADINMDLIAGLPGECFEDFKATISKVLELAPESVTVHTLAMKRSSRMHEEWRVREGSRSRAGRSDVDRMVDYAREVLTQSGWGPYYLYRQKYMAGNLENVGYARPGYACLYNIGNMEETASVLALGAGAISKWLFDREWQAARQGYDPEELRFRNLQLRIERAPNVRSIEQYIDRVDEMVERKRAVIFPEG